MRSFRPLSYFLLIIFSQHLEPLSKSPSSISGQGHLVTEMLAPEFREDILSSPCVPFIVVNNYIALNGINC